MIQHSFPRPRFQAILPLVVLLLLCAVRSSAQASPVVSVAEPAANPQQNLAKPLAFDVVSIHENKSMNQNGMLANTADGISITNYPLPLIISKAYGIKPYLISGAPGWFESTAFNIRAKVTGEDVPALDKLTADQRAAMLRPLLADRFHLKVHVVTKNLPAYDLVISKGGPKLKDLPPSSGKANAKARECCVWNFGSGYFTAEVITAQGIAAGLGNIVHRTVIDKTGLTGEYKFSLKFAPQEQADSAKPDNGSTDSAPSIFTALQEQLGLKLQPGRGPVDTLVIDHVEKPTEN